MVTVLELAVDTDHLPRYNMRRAALRPPPSAKKRVLATPQSESTSVQAKPSGPAPQIDEVVIALAQAAAAIATQGRATEPGPLVAAVDLKHADLQQLVSSDLLLTLMPEAEPEDAAGEGLDVPLLSVDPVGAADASPLDAKPCAGRTSPSDVISAADGWSVPSRSEPLTPIFVPRNSESWACAFPECTKAYFQRDCLRKHARRYHATWLRSNHTSFYRTSDEAEGKLWDCAEATGWCVLDDSQVCTPAPLPDDQAPSVLSEPRHAPPACDPPRAPSHPCTAPTRSRAATSTWRRAAASSRARRRRRRCASRRRP